MNISEEEIEVVKSENSEIDIKIVHHSIEDNSDSEEEFSPNLLNYPIEKVNQALTYDQKKIFSHRDKQRLYSYLILSDP